MEQIMTFKYSVANLTSDSNLTGERKQQGKQEWSNIVQLKKVKHERKSVSKTKDKSMLRNDTCTVYLQK